MEFSTKRVKALTKKEFKSYLKNSNVLLMSLLPIIFSIVYSYIYSGSSAQEGVPKLEILMLCLNMNLTMCASFVMAMLIAEEKEKNTLRTLLLSGVSAMEFLAGKVFITFLVSELTNIIIFFIIGINISHLGWYLLFSFLVVISMMFIGAVIGMIAPNQMSTGVIGMPVLMLLLLVPMMAEFNENLKKAAKFTPNYNMNLLFGELFTGKSLTSGDIFPVAVMVIWIFLTAILFFIIYNKVGIDK